MAHYYSRDGRPTHTLQGKNGLQRETTLKDARRLLLVPSVSEVLSVIARPGLEAWKSEQIMMAALTLPKLHGEDEATYLARIRQDSRRQAQEAANEGTRIHASVEKFYLGKSIPPEHWPQVEAATNAVRTLFPDVHDWQPERTFAHLLGFGGCCDLHSPSTGTVVDFKTTDKDRASDKRLAYDQYYQLAAYQVGLGLHECHGHSVCANVFISRTEPGIAFTHVWQTYDIERGWNVFKAALALWKELKSYNGGW